MKALAAYRYGTPEVLQVIETERPTPGDQEVLIRIHASTLELSAHAEYKCLPAFGSLAHMPKNLSYIEGAAVVDGALTALPFLRDASCIKSGQQVLINGARVCRIHGCTIGSYYGAQVTGVCSSVNFERVGVLGAKRVIDYNKSDFTQSGQSYDIIFDAVGKSTFGKCKRVLTSEGVYLSTVPTLSLMLQMMEQASAAHSYVEKGHKKGAVVLVM